MGRAAIIKMCRPVRLYYELLYTSYANIDRRYLRHHDTDEHWEVFKHKSEVLWLILIELFNFKFYKIYWNSHGIFFYFAMRSFLLEYKVVSLILKLHVVKK